MAEVIQVSDETSAKAVEGSIQGERECKFLKFCEEHAQRLEQASNVQPSRWNHPPRRVSAVSSGQYVTVPIAPSKEHDRKISAERLRYIESERKEFPRIAAKYRWYLDEAMRQYKSFIE